MHIVLLYFVSLWLFYFFVVDFLYQFAVVVQGSWSALGQWYDYTHMYIYIYIYCKKRGIFSCDQAALWMVQSVRLSLRPFVRLSVSLWHHFHGVPLIVPSWNFQKLLSLTEVMSMRKVKVRRQRSRSQRSWPHIFQTVTPLWIHIWQWNDANSLIMLRRGALLFLKVIRQISRSHG